MEQYEIDVLKRTVTVLQEWIDTMEVKDCPCTNESYELIGRLGKIITVNSSEEKLSEENNTIESDYVKSYLEQSDNTNIIHTVVRGTDNEEFSIGDKTNFGKIYSFKDSEVLGTKTIKVIMENDTETEYTLNGLHKINEN